MDHARISGVLRRSFFSSAGLTHRVISVCFDAVADAAGAEEGKAAIRPKRGGRNVVARESRARARIANAAVNVYARVVFGVALVAGECTAGTRDAVRRGGPA